MCLTSYVNGSNFAFYSRPLFVRAIPTHWIDTELRYRAGGCLGPTEGENMRIAWNVVGAVLVFFGSVWVLQGVNVLPGSFMSGQMRWAVRGGIAVVAGIALLLWANRNRQRAA